MTQSAKARVKAARPIKKPAKPSIAARRSKFLDVLRRTANISRAVRESGLPSSTAYRHRMRYPAFGNQWDNAVAEALDELEDIVIDRVRNGVEKPIFFGGEEKGVMRVYSDNLAMFILKAKRPEIYDRLHMPGGAGSTSIPAPQELTESEAAAEVDRRLAQLARPGRR